MSSIDASPDWSFYSIAAAFGLAALPVAYSYGRLLVASNGRMQNVGPRANLDALKGKIPQEVWNHCYRARCAHFNALEGLPIFAAAVLAGRFGGVPLTIVNAFSLQYLGLRVLYTLLYINTRTHPYSWLRSGVWFYSSFLPIQLLYKTGRLANGMAI